MGNDVAQSTNLAPGDLNMIQAIRQGFGVRVSEGAEFMVQVCQIKIATQPMQSSRLRAKRLTLFVMMTSRRPSIAACIMSLNPGRCSVFVPLKPSSTYVPMYSQLGFARIFFWYSSFCSSIDMTWSMSSVDTRQYGVCRRFKGAAVGWAIGGPVGGLIGTMAGTARRVLGFTMAGLLCRVFELTFSSLAFLFPRCYIYQLTGR